MDYEDLDSILKNKECNNLRNSVNMASVESFSRVHEWLSNEPTGDPPSTADAQSAIYAQINRGNKNSSRSVDCWNSQPNSCLHEGNVDELYSVVKKTSASAGFDIYRASGANYSTVGHMSPYNAASPDYNFYQLEKPLGSSVNHFADDQQPPEGDYYDIPFNPYEEVTLRIRDINNSRHDFAAADDDDHGENGLYSCIRSDDKIDDRQMQASMSLTGAMCTRCQQGFSKDEEIVNSNGQIWHRKCFVCGQCFQQFPDGVFYEFEGRKYCVHDFNVLFAPCCGLCKEFIIGRVIKAMNLSWHPDCFSCQLCQAPLADAGFIKNAGRALCRECNAKEKARGTGKYVCHKCHSIIEEGHIKFKGEAYHPYHFNCTTCSVELNADAREKGGELYCLRCHDKMGIPICGACRRPIEERVVYALGKAWHVEHFVCAKCEKPFLGTRHYEKKGLAYCETHYHQLFGNICFVCNCVVAGDVFTALNKAWCVDHFACSVCDRKMSQKTKFFEVDLKPVCKMCYEKFPAELKKRLKKAYDQQMKK